MILQFRFSILKKIALHKRLYFISVSNLGSVNRCSSIFCVDFEIQQQYRYPEHHSPRYDWLLQVRSLSGCASLPYGHQNSLRHSHRLVIPHQDHCFKKVTELYTVVFQYNGILGINKLILLCVMEKLDWLN